MVILGFGTMGKQIAALLLLLGYDVVIWSYSQKEDDEQQLQRYLKLLRKQLKFDIEISVSTQNFIYDLDSLPCGMYIECVKEDLELKKMLYEKFIQKSEIYFSNTSSYELSEIGSEAKGLHFFNPISLQLVEYYSVEKPDSAFQSLLDKLSNQGFTLVPVKDNRGFIANYILFNEISMVFKLIEVYKYSYEQINIIYTKLYDQRNIFQIIDIVGIDLTQKIIKNLAEKDNTIYEPKLFQIALNQNILGKKNKTSILDIM